jgi:hypothetical protein
MPDLRPARSYSPILSKQLEAFMTSWTWRNKLMASWDPFINPSWSPLALQVLASCSLKKAIATLVFRSSWPFLKHNSAWEQTVSGRRTHHPIKRGKGRAYIWKIFPLQKLMSSINPTPYVNWFTCSENFDFFQNLKPCLSTTIDQTANKGGFLHLSISRLDNLY